MRKILINSKTNQLYLDEGLAIPLSIPFNLPAALFTREGEKFKLVWITTTLLEASGKEEYLKKRIILKWEFLITNEIIPNYLPEDFLRQLHESIQYKKLLVGNFSSISEEADQFTSHFIPHFLPLYSEPITPTHVLFFISGNKYLLDYSQINFLTYKDRFDKFEDILLENNPKATIQFNSLYRISKVNNKARKLFPKLGIKKGLYFTDLFSKKNLSAIFSAIDKIKIIRNEKIELQIFEEFDNDVIKLNLTFYFLFEDTERSSHFFCSIESLNEYLTLEKELTKKIFLLGSYEKLIDEISKSDDISIHAIEKIICNTFDFTCILFWNKTDNALFFISNGAYIGTNSCPSEFIQKHFSSITPNNFKIKNASREETDNPLFKPIFKGIKQFIGIPIYEDENQLGTIIYLTDRIKFDIELINPLQGITKLTWPYLKREKYFEYFTMKNQISK